jgi:membrane fusion protein (multidrug efflux system)
MLRYSPGRAVALAVVVLLSACGGGDSGAGGNRAAQGGGGGPGGPRPGGPGNRPQDRPIPVEVVLVERGRIPRTTTVAGLLEPIRTVGVNAQASGPLLSVRVIEGDRVRAGQLLAEVDVRELESQVRAAEANLEFASSTMTRSDELWKQKIITAAEHERDKAALAAARASLDQLRMRVGFAKITAPISGVITEKRVEAGDVVGNQARLFTISDVSVLVTRVQVSELEVTALRPGGRADISVDALPNDRFEGRIRRVFPAADSATRLVPVEVELSGSALQRLRPGYTTRVTFLLDPRDDALLVPTRAVLGPAGSRTVFLVKQGRAERRAVRVGPDVAGRSEVYEGLHEGDSLVVAGNALVRDGGLIRVVPPLSDRPGTGAGEMGAQRDSAARRDSVRPVSANRGTE